MPYHIECKRTEKLSLYKALEQAEDDAGDETPAVVFHRRNGKQWVVIMGGDEWLDAGGAKKGGIMIEMKLKTTGEIHDTITGYDFTVDKPLIRSKAIRVKCLECCRNSSAEIKICPVSDCALWPYRLGRGVCTDPEGVRVKTKAHIGGFKKKGE